MPISGARVVKWWLIATSVIAVVLLLILTANWLPGLFRPTVRNSGNDGKPVSRVAVDARVLQQLCTKPGNAATWQTGTESAPDFIQQRRRATGLAQALGCECEGPFCRICRIDGLSWYRFFSDGDRYIVLRQYDDNGSAYLDVRAVSALGVQQEQLCTKVLVRDSPRECPIAKKFDGKNELKELFLSERRRAVAGLRYTDRVLNGLYDISLSFSYLLNEPLNPDSPIKDVLRLVASERGLTGYVYQDTFYVDMPGGEMKSIMRYALDGTLLGEYCRNTWNIGGRGDSNPSCQVPAGSVRVVDYLKALETACGLDWGIGELQRGAGRFDLARGEGTPWMCYTDDDCAVTYSQCCATGCPDVAINKYSVNGYRESLTCDTSVACPAFPPPTIASCETLRKVKCVDTGQGKICKLVATQ